MTSGSPDMCTSESINVGMLTSSNAAAMSSSDVSNGSPACGLRMCHSTQHRDCVYLVIGGFVRHVVIDGPGRVRVADGPEPVPPGDDGAVVAVDAAAICGSD